MRKFTSENEISFTYLSKKGVIPVFMLILMIIITVISVGYAALNTNLNIFGEAFMRAYGSIRITSLDVDSQEHEGHETYSPEYSKRSVKVYSTLPNIDSKITYNAQITNTTGVKYTVSDIKLSSTNPNVECTSTLIKDSIIEMGTSYFTLEVKYKSDAELNEELTDVCEINYEFSILDVTPPTLTVSLISATETTRTVKITAEDNIEGTGISEENNFKYYLSTSDTTLSSGEWKEYVNGEEIVLDGENQEKYLWVYPVKDNAGNINDNKTSIQEPYKIASYNFITTYTLTVNLNGGTLNGSTENKTYSMQYGTTRGIANPTKSGYIFGGWTISGTGSSMSGTVFKIGTTDATITAIWKSTMPSYTYTGESEVIDDGDGNWRIKFLTSGTLTFNDLGNATGGIDIFLVGGGGGGGYSKTETIKGTFGLHSNNWGYYSGAYKNRYDGGGGGGGYTKTMTNISVDTKTSYEIVIGAGGAAGASDGASGSTGGVSQITNIDEATANGGSGGAYKTGGSGGSGGGVSAYHKQWTTTPCTSNGRACLSVSDEYSNASSGASDGGTSSGSGQGTTTREFGSPTGTLYAGGGGGGAENSTSGSNGAGGSGGGGAGHTAGVANTGGGGGAGAAGGSGIIIIKNHESLVTGDGVSYTYTGDSEFISDGGDNWKIKFLTSGTLTFHSIVNVEDGVDIFLVGGGGGGGYSKTETIKSTFGLHSNNWGYYSGAYNNRYDGGGGGYTKTMTGITIELSTQYDVVVGAGGAAGTSSNTTGVSGGVSQITNITDATANGGGGGAYNTGGSGGSGGGVSAYHKQWTTTPCTSNGRACLSVSDEYSNASSGASDGGTSSGSGQGTTTREFGESDGTLYAGGGGGGAENNTSGSNGAGGAGGGGAAHNAGVANTGGGGGAGSPGGFGIIIIRNHRG